MVQARNNAAVLGKPIAHSLSPVLHNAAYEALSLSDWAYGLHEVAESDLESFIGSLDSSWRGLSLTMPLKKRVIALGTARDKWSQFLQVANTAVFRGGEDSPVPAPANAAESHIDLYNTDVFGIEAALNDAGEPDTMAIAEANAPCLIIGSGSTAASALAALSEMGAQHITFAARTPVKLATHQRMAAALNVETEAIALDDVPAFLADRGDKNASLHYIVSTVPAHAADSVAQEIGALDVDLSASTVLDVVYDPSPTALMGSLASRGAEVVGGERMLLWQAVAQVSLMTGVPQTQIPVGAMREALKAELLKRGLEK